MKVFKYVCPECGVTILNKVGICQACQYMLSEKEMEDQKALAHKCEYCSGQIVPGIIVSDHYDGYEEGYRVESCECGMYEDDREAAVYLSRRKGIITYLSDDGKWYTPTKEFIVNGVPISCHIICTSLANDCESVCIGKVVQ